MFDSRGCSTPTERGSVYRGLFLGITLAALASFTGALGFTSTALSANDAQMIAGEQVSASTCPCGSGGPCCGHCTPSQSRK